MHVTPRHVEDLSLLQRNVQTRSVQNGFRYRQMFAFPYLLLRIRIRNGNVLVHGPFFLTVQLKDQHIPIVGMRWSR